MEKLKRENLNKLMRNFNVKSIDLFSLIKNDNIFKILNLAEKNNFNIWIVGGALRDFFLKKNINDFDFVYDIKPLELVEILKTNKLDFISSYVNFGVIIIKLNNKKYTLTSLREDFKQDGRFTKVRYIKSINKDSLRRDLTFNSLYMDTNQRVYDFHNGLKHLENSKVIFIGDFKKKCLEDHLRIIRFIRFCSLFKSPMYPNEYISFFLKNKNLISNLKHIKVSNEIEKALSYQYKKNTISILKKLNIESFIFENF
jgi:tRNA nucleotidyltransferase/poly(A) polymerase